MDPGGGGRHGAHDPAAADHGDLVGDLAHLAQLVGDEQQGLPVRAQLRDAAGRHYLLLTAAPADLQASGRRELLRSHGDTIRLPTTESDIRGAPGGFRHHDLPVMSEWLCL